MGKAMMVSVLCLVAMACAYGPDAVVDESAEANKAMVRTYMHQVINQRDWSVWPEIFAETVSFNGQTMTMTDMRAMTDAFRSILPDMQLTIEFQMASGDTVVTRVTVTGTHEGDYMGLKASGKKVSFNGLALDRIEGGKIVEMWHEMNIWGTLLMAADD